MSTTQITIREICSRHDLELDTVRLQRGWTPQRVTVLAAAWREGLSASEIAKGLTDLSRNAVIGKVHRLGLAHRSAGYQPARKRAARARSAIRQPRAPSPPRLRAIRTEEDTEGSGGPSALRFLGIALDVLTISEATCKFPEGDPKHDTFAFCGRPALMGVCPYCVDHARVAYQAGKAPKQSYVQEFVRRRTHYGWGSHL